MLQEEIEGTGKQEGVLPVVGTYTKFDESFLESLLGPQRVDDNPLWLLEVDEYTVIENARLEVVTAVPEPSTFLMIAGGVLVALGRRFRKGR